MVKPTRSGIALILAGLIAIALGRIFGALEPYLIGAMALAAVLLAWLYLLAVRLKLIVSRTVSPVTVRAGSPIRVDLSVANSRQMPTPILRIDDEIDESPGPSVHVAPIFTEQEANVAYRMPAQRRGQLSLGPLTLTTTDPFNLWSSSMKAGQSLNLLVRPEILDLTAMTDESGFDPDIAAQLSRSVASAGDEFYALRPYVAGDELRKVNWRASARLDELVVRQDENPKTGRTTLIFDLSPQSYSSAGFERAVSSVSSVLHSATSNAQSINFITSDGSDVVRVSETDLERLEETLALISTSRVSSLSGVLDRHLSGGQGGRMILVTGYLNSDSVDALSRAGRSYEQLIPILCEPVQAGSAAVGLANLVLHDGRGDPREAWAKAILSQTIQSHFHG